MIHTTRRSLSAVVALLLFAAVGCGGDDSSGNETSEGDTSGDGAIALSDEQFCELVVALEEQNVEASGDDEQFLEDIRGLRAVAPNDEVRSALATFEEFLDSVADFDQDDPEAFGEIFAMMETPEFVEAEATLERYSVETCGLGPSDE